MSEWMSAARMSFDEIVDRRGSGCYKWDEAEEDGVIPMWVADMDFRTAPVIIEALQKRVAHGVFGYTLIPDAYYEAVINWFKRRHSWEIKREWIQYTSGVVPAISVIVKAFTKPGDQVILQTPVYNCFFSSVRNNGCQIIQNTLKRDPETRKYSMDYEDLEAKASDPKTKLLILCNPHNPVGRVWTREELARVCEICSKNNVIVVSDEIHNELVFEGRRYVAYGTVDMENTIVCTSSSKSFNTAGLQIANIICKHPEWQKKIDRAINDNEVCDVNPFGVVGLMAAYNEGEPWLNSLCDYLFENYKALCHFFETEMPQLKVTPLEGTYLVWLDIRALGMTSDAVTEKLLKKGKVQVSSGTLYGTDGEGFIRINIACPRSQMMEGLHRIRSAIQADD